MDSSITYSQSGTPGSPDEPRAEPSLPRTIGAWKVHTAIRHALEGSTVNGTASAAIRAGRETPAAWACAAAQVARILPACGVCVIVVMCCPCGSVRAACAAVLPHGAWRSPLIHHCEGGIRSLWRGKGHAARARSWLPLGEVDELHGHLRRVSHVESLSDPDRPLDRKHIAGLAVREDGRRPRAVPDRGPHPH